MRLTETKSVHFEKYACHYFQVAERHTAHIQTHSLLFILSTSFLLSLFADKCFMKDFSPPPPHILSRNNVLWMCPRDYMWHSPQVSSSSSPTWAAWARPRQNLEGRGRKKTGGEAYFITQNWLSNSVHSQSIIKGFILFRCESLKWVTRYIHCNITVNIHKLIII